MTMRTDVVESIGEGSLIQHGSCNDRIYLMYLDDSDVGGITGMLDGIALNGGYGKVFAKVPGRHRGLFERGGYVCEAEIPAFYPDGDAGAFMGKFFLPERAYDPHSANVKDILEMAMSKRDDAVLSRPLDECYLLRLLGEGDASRLAGLYGEIFKSYPFPIYDPSYLVGTMRDNIVYFGVERGGDLVAASSSETDMKNLNAEMTDFAVTPRCRGASLAVHLLRAMEEEMCVRGVKSLYTIARALSAGMNITFARCGYIYAGTLVNNTDIAGRIESMNVWYKDFTRHP